MKSGRIRYGGNSGTVGEAVTVAVLDVACVPTEAILEAYAEKTHLPKYIIEQILDGVLQLPALLPTLI
jgi:ABC-type antimicrobial peptide transport system permease subunit